MKDVKGAAFFSHALLKWAWLRREPLILLPKVPAAWNVPMSRRWVLSSTEDSEQAPMLHVQSEEYTTNTHTINANTSTHTTTNKNNHNNHNHNDLTTTTTTSTTTS